MFNWLRIKIKITINFTNLAGLIIATISSMDGHEGGVLIGAILIFGRKGLSAVNKFIELKYGGD